MTAGAPFPTGDLPGSPVSPWTPRRAYRASDGGMIGGVAEGVARHLGVPVLWLRIGLLASVALGGLGVVLYGALWLVLPAEPDPAPGAPGLDAATRQGRRGGSPARRLADHTPLAAVGAIAVGALLALGLATGQTLSLGPLVVAALGVALLWWQADQAQRERRADDARRVHPVRAVVGAGGTAAYLRIAVGLVLVVLAASLFALRGGLAVALDVGMAAAVAVLGLGLVAAPWLVRLAADLSSEREARIRSEERADVAAHLHDSVLQTLALIQRSSGDPATVARLARSQERDLRRWLFEPDEVGPASLADGLRATASEVEDATGVPVEVICVGDVRLTEASRPLVLAAREAMHNAARHSGAPRVDVYAEAGPETLEVFVRDRGRGFDPETVPADRRGLRGSVVGRMERHGGAAEVRSTAGEGTEVELRLPRGVAGADAGPEGDEAR